MIIPSLDANKVFGREQGCQHRLKTSRSIAVLRPGRLCGHDTDGLRVTTWRAHKNEMVVEPGHHLGALNRNMLHFKGLHIAKRNPTGEVKLRGR